MVTDIGLGVVVAVGVLLGLVAGMVVGWIASRRMGRKDFALQSDAIRAESESEVARLNAELIEAQGQIRVLETDRASLQGEKSSAKSLEDRLEPVRDALEGLRRTTQQAEVERAKSAAALRTQIDGAELERRNAPIDSRPSVHRKEDHVLSMQHVECIHKKM